MKMGCDHATPTRPVSPNADLVERCKSAVGSLSAHVEARLATGPGMRRVQDALDIVLNSF
jgi:hypothetical protein